MTNLEAQKRTTQKSEDSGPRPFCVLTKEQQQELFQKMIDSAS